MEVADIFRAHGAAWLRANRGHVSYSQLRVMSAIKVCRTAALGGHVIKCEGCTHTVVAYNSCLMGSVYLWGAGSNNVRDRRVPTDFHSPLRTCLSVERRSG